MGGHALAKWCSGTGSPQHHPCPAWSPVRSGGDNKAQGFSRLGKTHFVIGDMQFPDDIVLVDILRLQCHCQLPKLHWLVLLGGPVLVAALFSLFHSIAQQHDGATLELPHHPPHVTHGVLQGSLSDYVCVPLLVALEEWSTLKQDKLRTGCEHTSTKLPLM